MERDCITSAERLAPVDDKRARAVHYLRTQSKRGYCLDGRVARLPAPQRPPTLLDRWLARRSA